MSRFPNRPGWRSPEPCSRLIVYRLDLRGSTGFWIGGSGGNSGWENRGPEMNVTRNPVLTRSIEDGPPQGARQIFEKSPARHPPRRAAGRHPLGARASRPHPVPANPPSPASPWPTAPRPLERSFSPGVRLTAQRCLSSPTWLSTLQAASSNRRLAAAQPQCDSAGSDPVGGLPISQAEGEQWRHSRLIEVGETSEAVPGLVRAGRPRSQEVVIP